MKKRIEHCDKSGGKYMFSSQAKATRSMNRYDDIKRVYKCSECGSWHTTSIDREEAIKMGIEVYTPRHTPMSVIKNRMKELKKKILN